MWDGDEEEEVNDGADEDAAADDDDEWKEYRRSDKETMESFTHPPTSSPYEG